MAYNATNRPLDAQAITPSDTALNNYFDVYVGVTGDVTVVTKAAYAAFKEGRTSTEVSTLFKGVPAGYRLGVQVARVKATGTTATNLVGYGPT